MEGEKNEIQRNLQEKDKLLDEYVKDRQEEYNDLVEELNYQQEKVREFEQQGFVL